MSGLIESQIKQIKRQIPEHVRLIAVSKQVSVEAIREAYQVGIRDFAENRLQEAMEKQAQLTDLTDISWHFIGHLQANKAKKVIACFEWIHSTDNLKIAQGLNRLAAEAMQKGVIKSYPKIFLQVKILPDPNKYGWQADELLKDLPIINNLESLQICGLMSILPFGLSSEETLMAFTQVKNLAQQIQAQNWSNLTMNQLSMGMSGDYLLAIKAGATMIRLGTIIFRSNNTK